MNIVEYDEQNNEFGFLDIIDPKNTNVEAIRYRISFIIEIVLLLVYIFGGRYQFTAFKLRHAATLEAILTFVFMKINRWYVLFLFSIYLTVVVVVLTRRFEIRRRAS
jgi:uncharacterized membrane protein